MNVIHLLNHQRRNLHSTIYVDALWQTIRGKPIYETPTSEDEEIYRSHLPLEFSDFLMSCVTNLRQLRNAGYKMDWSSLDQKYVNTLIYFSIVQEDVPLVNALYGSSMFLLFNVLRTANTRFFFHVIYKKVLETFEEFLKCQNTSNPALLYTLDDFKMFISRLSLPEDLVLPTIAVIQEYTYCTEKAFDKIDASIPLKDLGYIAFVCLKILSEQLSQQRDPEEKVFPILASLTSSLKSTNFSEINLPAKITHQQNVQVFIRENFSNFHSSAYCMVSKMLKLVCLMDGYNEYVAIACIIQNLPRRVNHKFLRYYQKTLTCNNVQFRKNLLELIIPIIRNPPEYENLPKQQCRAIILIQQVLILCLDDNKEVKIKCMQVLSNYSETPVGRRTIRKAIDAGMYGQDIPTDSFFDMFNELSDRKWRDKSLNTDYVRLICNLLIAKNQLGSTSSLRRFTVICTKATPTDLKPCMHHFRRVLECGFENMQVTLCMLKVFVRQTLNSTETTKFFAETFYKYIFDHVKSEGDYEFMWYSIGYFMTDRYDYNRVFDKFHDLNLMERKPLRVLMEYKIQQLSVRIPALKLMNILLSYMSYNECHCLDELLEKFLLKQGYVWVMVFYIEDVFLALLKILKQKKLEECSEMELTNHMRMQEMLNQAFAFRALPNTNVRSLVRLLCEYKKFTPNKSDDWYIDVNMEFQKKVQSKLRRVLRLQRVDFTHISRDAAYLGELSLSQKLPVDDKTMRMMRRIINCRSHSAELATHLRNNEHTWAVCIGLYVKVTIVHTHMIPECIRNLLQLLDVGSNALQMRILMCLYDICYAHLEHYDPLIPHLFKSLTNRNRGLRRFAYRLITKLLDNNRVRLMDYNYFAFMKVLGDSSDISRKCAKQFIRQRYFSMDPQAIARHFVPGIVFYNGYLEHPSFIFNEEECAMIRKGAPLKYGRRTLIYFVLYEVLDLPIKMNILNQMHEEVLKRLISGEMPASNTTFRILNDCLNVILFMVPVREMELVEESKSFYGGMMDYIDNTILINDDPVAGPSKGYDSVLSNIMIDLFQLLYGNFGGYSKACQNLLFAIVMLTRHLTAQIKLILSEQDSNLGEHYKSLRPFYEAKSNSLTHYSGRVNSSTILDRYFFED